MKILKYLIGLITAIGGVMALFGGSRSKKVKELKDDNNLESKWLNKKYNEIWFENNFVKTAFSKDVLIIFTSSVSKNSLNIFLYQLFLRLEINVNF